MRRRRRLWIALLAVPLLVLAGDTLYWSIAERNLADGFAAWVAWRRSEGWTVSAAPAQRGGWPLRAMLSIPGMSLVGGAPVVPGGVSWSAERLRLAVDLLRPGTLQASLGGQQSLRVGHNPPVSFTARSMRFAVPLDSALPPPTIDLTAQQIAIRTPLPRDANATTHVATLFAHLDFRPAALSGEPAVGVSLQAATLTPPPSVGRVLGATIASLTINGAVEGPVVPAATVTQAATAWRDGGGTLRIRHIALAWGPLDLTGGGTLALDQQLQPTGSGNARIVGYAETLDRLAENGVISHSAATAAKAVLSLLAQQPADGAQPDVDVPLSVQDRKLSMHAIPLLRLPEIAWPHP